MSSNSQKEGTPVSEPKALTDRSVADLWKEVKDPETFWDNLHDEMAQTVRHLLESTLEEEMLEQLQPRGTSATLIGWTIATVPTHVP